jgi:hypothetical protein
LAEGSTFRLDLCQGGGGQLSVEIFPNF